MNAIGIIGAGTMGHGIAQCFAVKGWQVRLYDAHAETMETVLGRIRATLGVFVEAGIIDGDTAESALARVLLCDALTMATQGPDLIIETISEDLEIKRRLFTELEGLVGPETILCTNTSAISISAISQGLQHPERILGTHFWNPPHVLPCVEVIKSNFTSDAVFEKVVAIMAAIGKEPIRVLKDVPGFVGNRMQHALQREAMDLVDQGIAAPEEVDRVVKYGFGLRLALMGPLERADLGGLDITYRVQKYLLPYLCNQTTSAVRFLRERKIDFRPHFYAYEEHGGTHRAAEMLKIPEHSIIKTLVMKGDSGQPFIVLQHGDCQVSTKELARQIGVKRINPCDEGEAQKHTGYQVGGISPFGTRKTLPVYAEKSIFSLDRLVINGGKRGFLIEISPEDLSRTLPLKEVETALKK